MRKHERKNEVKGMQDGEKEDGERRRAVRSADASSDIGFSEWW
jgi:hypothetical protein